jgi:hypothetical protein
VEGSSLKVEVERAARAEVALAEAERNELRQMIAESLSDLQGRLILYGGPVWVSPEFATMLDTNECLDAEEEAGDTGEAALATLGFPDDCWMPIGMAKDWRSCCFPLNDSQEAVAQWEALLRECATQAFARRQKECAERILADLAHDKELLVQHAPHIWSAPPSPRIAATSTPVAPSPPSTPPGNAESVDYLVSWREILDALSMKNNKDNQRKVRGLHDGYGSPILMPPQGGQPKVVKTKLLDWWHGLERRFEEEQQREADRRETVKETYNYGRDGRVVPGIQGHIKRPRKDKGR